MKIISLSEAKSLNLTHYFTGEPCRRGHLDRRYVKTRGCVSCGRAAKAAQVAADPEKHRKQAADWRKNNPKSVEKASKKWRETHRPKIRQAHLARSRKTKYGLSPQEVEELHTKQQGNCPGCLKSLDHAGTPHLDHCHSTGKVRGLLCARCNVALGFVYDSSASLRRLAEYLDQNVTV